MKTHTATNPDAKHFELVRLAITRGVRPERHGMLYRVPSYSTPGESYSVTRSGLCHCKAADAGRRCTHSELVRREVARESDYRGYGEAEARDRLALQRRVLFGTLTKADKTYLRYCVRLAEKRMREREAVKASGIRRVESRGRVKEYAGTFQV